jgi:hypothetical protein
MKLTDDEKYCYNVAYAAATGKPVKDTLQQVCFVCNGAGLLKHPDAPFGVAPCYMCGSWGVSNNKKKRVEAVDCGCAGSKTLPNRG